MFCNPVSFFESVLRQVHVRLHPLYRLGLAGEDHGGTMRRGTGCPIKNGDLPIKNGEDYGTS